MDEADTAPELLFRPSKRRKFIPRRANDTDSVEADTPSRNDNQTPEALSTGDEDQTAQPTNVVRLRRPHQARKGGIGFSATSRSKNGNRQTALASAEEIEADRIQAMADRFTTYTGQSEDVDKHMYDALFCAAQPDQYPTNKIRMAYIDSEMAKRSQRNPLLDNSEASQSAETHNASEASIPDQQRAPASLGKLQEIDLGQETTMQNIARTEAARRRIAGDKESPNSDEPERPGRSGADKVWRNRKQRTSADIERDRLVEQVMRESRLEIYDEPEDEGVGDDQDADDRIAEKFRLDFMDAIQSRRRLRPTRTTTEKTEGPKGPKLGGSRSARAAMREMQSKGQK
ncbi:hypothetical protein N7520_010802 [Penicillium odoratum]|uniref:uncharacterized protein n=1 Tax=Penicillium odoratum TaxID=1167516 RepID=UPI002548FE5B|nr:uncharacterized protein N7520_010802 [Penicillium odoratum]KAJ5745620.1 hypothetical protein N7520_010802 [Penicillium odoratum]